MEEGERNEPEVGETKVRRGRNSEEENRDVEKGNGDTKGAGRRGERSQGARGETTRMDPLRIGRRDRNNDRGGKCGNGRMVGRGTRTTRRRREGQRLRDGV